MNVLPLPWRAVQADFAAEQVRQLAADRQSQAGAAVLAARAGVGLLERLEDDFLLVGRDADAGVASPRRPPPTAARLEDRVLGVQPMSSPRRRRPHRSVLGELERVGQQVLEHLQQPLGSVTMLRVRPDRTRW